MLLCRISYLFPTLEIIPPCLTALLSVRLFISQKTAGGRYAIVDIAEQEEYEKAKAALQLMCEFDKGRQSGEEQGWKDLSEIRRHFTSPNVTI